MPGDNSTRFNNEKHNKQYSVLHQNAYEPILKNIISLLDISSLKATGRTCRLFKKLCEEKLGWLFLDYSEPSNHIEFTFPELTYIYRIGMFSLEKLLLILGQPGGKTFSVYIANLISLEINFLFTTEGDFRDLAILPITFCNRNHRFVIADKNKITFYEETGKTFEPKQTISVDDEKRFLKLKVTPTGKLATSISHYMIFNREQDEIRVFEYNQSNKHYSEIYKVDSPHLTAFDITDDKLAISIDDGIILLKYNQSHYSPIATKSFSMINSGFIYELAIVKDYVVGGYIDDCAEKKKYCLMAWTHQKDDPALIHVKEYEVDETCRICNIKATADGYFAAEFYQSHIGIFHHADTKCRAKVDINTKQMDSTKRLDDFLTTPSGEIIYRIANCISFYSFRKFKPALTPPEKPAPLSTSNTTRRNTI